MKVIIDDKQFMKEMNNIIAYAGGFVDGAIMATPKLLKNLGTELKVLIGEYIDSSARMDPESLHHVYEWYQTGSPDARLFDISYVVTGKGLSINSTFTQSTSVRNGSTVPFYDKARMMEAGVSVTVKPRNSQVLAFDADGQTVFTPNAVTINNPGGRSVENSFEKNFKSFFQQYLSQTMLDISGISKDIKNPIGFKKNLNSGKNGGRAVGLRVGNDWIAKAGI